MATQTLGDTLRKKERVVAAVDMPGIPAGTPGKVTFVAGFEWIRYWVRFENGVTRGSLNRRKLLRPGEELPDPDAVVATEAPAAAATGDGAAAEGDGADDLVVGSVTIPGHLLERSRSRRVALGK